MAKKQDKTESGKVWVNGTELAKMVGVTQQRISALKRQGKIKESARGYHAPSCVNIINQLRADNVKHNAAGTSNTSLTDARTQHEIEKAKLAALEYRKRAGELIEKSEVEKFHREVTAIIKTKLLGHGGRCAPRVVGLTSVKRIKKILDDNIYECLEELSRLT